MAIRQYALSVIAPVRREARETVAAALSRRQRDVVAAFPRLSTVHFARWVLLPGPDGEPNGRLAFESNHDGDRGEHLAELLRVLGAAGAEGDLELDLFGGWEGYEKGKLQAFCDAHSFRANAFYLGHPGLSAQRIREDRDLREALERAADSESIQRAGSAIEARRALLAVAEAQGVALGPVDREFPAQPRAKIEFYLTGVLVVLLGLVLLPLALVVEWHERLTEPKREPIDEEEEKKRDRINALEDATALNGLTHHVPLRPGVFRKTTMRIVLWFVEVARKKLCYQGNLDGIATIHFARWIVLDDDTVLFFSNYDGSWESYLGDFVDKAHYWLSAVWMGTKQFPATYAYIFGGAGRESEFKDWTRLWQVENQIWYSAYPQLSVANVLQNDRIRAGAVGDMNEEEARAWLSLI